MQKPPRKQYFYDLIFIAMNHSLVDGSSLDTLSLVPMWEFQQLLFLLIGIYTMIGLEISKFKSLFILVIP
jgi:hypothetical protein